MKTRTQVADEYGISRRTLYSWLKRTQICKTRKLLSPKDLSEIYELYGYPNQKDNLQSKNIFFRKFEE